MRLIDADALREHIADLPTWTQMRDGEWRPKKYPAGVFDPEDVMSSIDNAPTIDAEPVRHGTWIEECGVLHSSGRVVTCPLCHKQHFIPSRTMSWWVSDESVFQKPDRCRNCGATMDGGGSNEN